MMGSIVLIMSVEASSGNAVPEFIQHVGAEVRGIRRALGWTVQMLADASHVSRRMLTQIELGQANPSLVTIDRIARALGTDFAGLTRARPSVAMPDRAVAATRVWEDQRGSEAVLLAATSPATAAELWKWTLAPGVRYDARPDRPGTQEIHHVLSGVLRIESERGALVLATGDSAVIGSDQRYAYINDGAIDAVFHRVVVGA